jgi:hypothetical protein
LLPRSCGRSTPDEDDPHSLPLEGRQTLRELNARVAAVLDELACNSAALARSWCTPTMSCCGRGRLGIRTGPEVYQHVEVANCSITPLRVLDGVRRLGRANGVGHLERRGREGYYRLGRGRADLVDRDRTVTGERRAAGARDEPG